MSTPLYSIHTHTYYKKKKFKPYDFPNSVEYYKHVLSLLIFYFKNQQLKKIVDLLKKLCLLKH